MSVVSQEHTPTRPELETRTRERKTQKENPLDLKGVDQILANRNEEQEAVPRLSEAQVLS